MHRRRTRFAASITLVAVLAGLVPLVAASPAAAARQKTIKIADASVIEGDAGQKFLAFKVTWSGAKGGAVSVSYATADASATAGADYTAQSGTASLPGGGCRCASISVPVLGDGVTEDTETFQVNLSAPVNAVIGDAQAIGTIYDNEGPPSVVVLDASADENAGPLAFTVQLTNASASNQTVDYATANGTAVAGSDYVAASGTVTFAPNDTSETVSVALTNEALNEADETLTLSLANATIAVTDGSASGTIVNDDPEPTIAVSDVSAAEGDGVVSFTVTLSTASGQEINVDYETADTTAVAGDDYTSTIGTAVIAAGATSTTVDVPIGSDGTYEADDTFTLDLTSPYNATIADAQAVGTIANDDAPPAASVGDVAVAEGSATAPVTFAVTLSHTSAFDATIDWTTADGTALAGSDYAAASGTVTVPAGSTTGEIAVDVLGDTVAELDESFSVTLVGGSGATVGDGAGTGTITDDDRASTALTEKVRKTRTKVSAKGLLERAEAGAAVTVSLYRKKGANWIKLATKTVTVRKLADRDADGAADAQYGASFPRPKPGTYQFRAVFAGNATLLPCAKTVTVTI